MHLTPQEIVERYDNMLYPFARVELDPQGLSPHHLRWMLHQLRSPMEVGKANRWLGFIQAGIIRLGLTTVQAERDFTRPIFTGVN